MEAPELIYTATFFEKQQNWSVAAASVVVPIILEMFPRTKSVVDVGCGVGAWLAEFSRRGTTTVQGYDGGSADPVQMKISPECFQQVNLEQPPKPSRRYDLALCLEVGEHLPNSSARPFVNYLTELSDVVVFSAAVPGQGGRNHINEQPLSYWRKFFIEAGYDLYDPIRARIWFDKRIPYWYRQNIVVAAKRGISETAALKRIEDGDLIDVVHPELLTTARKEGAKKKKRDWRFWLRK